MQCFVLTAFGERLIYSMSTDSSISHDSTCNHVKLGSRAPSKYAITELCKRYDSERYLFICHCSQSVTWLLSEDGANMHADARTDIDPQRRAGWVSDCRSSHDGNLISFLSYTWLDVNDEC